MTDATPLFAETGTCEICERVLPIDRLTLSYNDEGWWGCWECYEGLVRDMKERGVVDGSITLNTEESA